MGVADGDAPDVRCLLFRRLTRLLGRVSSRVNAGCEFDGRRILGRLLAIPNTDALRLQARQRRLRNRHVATACPDALRARKSPPGQKHAQLTGL